MTSKSTGPNIRGEDPGERLVHEDRHPLNWIELTPDPDGSARFTLSLQLPAFVTSHDDGHHVVELSLKVTIKPLPRPAADTDKTQGKLPGLS